LYCFWHTKCPFRACYGSPDIHLFPAMALLIFIWFPLWLSWYSSASRSYTQNFHFSQSPSPWIKRPLNAWTETVTGCRYQHRVVLTHFYKWVMHPVAWNINFKLSLTHFCFMSAFPELLFNSEDGNSIYTFPRHQNTQETFYVIYILTAISSLRWFLQAASCIPTWHIGTCYACLIYTLKTEVEHASETKATRLHPIRRQLQTKTDILTLQLSMFQGCVIMWFHLRGRK
jgi:hypothetical protein